MTLSDLEKMEYFLLVLLCKFSPNQDLFHALLYLALLENVLCYAHTKTSILHFYIFHRSVK